MAAVGAAPCQEAASGQMITFALRSPLTSKFAVEHSV
jgi:hypothetical protein